jgi:hypothetical protein
LERSDIAEHRASEAQYGANKKEEQTMSEQADVKKLTEEVKLGAMDEKAREEMQKAVEEAREQIMTGIIELETPLKSKGQEVKELAFDFDGMQSADAIRILDRYMGDNAVTFSEAQRLAIFALSCRGLPENMGLDELDILEQIKGEDAMAGAFAGGRFLALAYAAINRKVKEKEKGSALLEGVMTLEKPLERKDKDGNLIETITELPYNFRRLAGSKYVECLEVTRKTPAGITYKAGISLFAEAVRTNRTLEKDELEKFTVMDTIAAGLVGMGFFLASRSRASVRMKKRPRI